MQGSQSTAADPNAKCAARDATYLFTRNNKFVIKPPIVCLRIKLPLLIENRTLKQI